MVPVAERKLAVIVLAAGCSSRLGQAKQLVKFHGQSLIVRQCQLALTVASEAYCVLGFQAQRMQQELASLSISCLENIEWQQGLASSIAHGVSAVSREADAVLLLLVDQWQLSQAQLAQLILQWQQMPEKIVCAAKNTAGGEKSTFGPPVIFPRRYFAQLTGLTQGQGAKSIIKSHQADTAMVKLEQAFVDLDTPEQLAELQLFLNKN